jgi:hypothetical protein
MVMKLYIFMENHRLSIFDTSVLRFISKSQKEELTGSMINFIINIPQKYPKGDKM